jgi:hypothetical protein
MNRQSSKEPPPPAPEQLASEQGVDLKADVDEFMGRGRDFWDNDADFERWLSQLEQIRHEGRAG